jgi:hypothetical protein
MGSLSLRERLIGAWELVSAVERDLETGVESNVLGERPRGFILYTPDGYMSAQLQGPARATFEEGDLLRGSPRSMSRRGVATSPTPGASSSMRPSAACRMKWQSASFPTGLVNARCGWWRLTASARNLAPTGPSVSKAH